MSQCAILDIDNCVGFSCDVKSAVSCTSLHADGRQTCRPSLFRPAPPASVCFDMEYDRARIGGVDNQCLTRDR
jgi:hypothetical protein